MSNPALKEANNKDTKAVEFRVRIGALMPSRLTLFFFHNLISKFLYDLIYLGKIEPINV